MNTLNRTQIQNLVHCKEDAFDIQLNEFGFYNIVEELIEYQNDGRDVNDQLDYIFTQAIMNGDRDEYLEE